MSLPPGSSLSASDDTPRTAALRCLDLSLAFARRTVGDDEIHLRLRRYLRELQRSTGRRRPPAD